VKDVSDSCGGVCSKAHDGQRARMRRGGSRTVLVNHKQGNGLGHKVKERVVNIQCIKRVVRNVRAWRQGCADVGSV